MWIIWEGYQVCWIRILIEFLYTSEQLLTLIYVLGEFVGSHIPYLSNVEDEALDGEVCSEILSLSRIQQQSCKTVCLFVVQIHTLTRALNIFQQAIM